MFFCSRIPRVYKNKKPPPPYSIEELQEAVQQVKEHKYESKGSRKEI